MWIFLINLRILFYVLMAGRIKAFEHITAQKRKG